jgi:hypothetical protein
MSRLQSYQFDRDACLAAERRIDAARLEAWRSDIQRRSGVCLSGFDPDPPRLRSEAELRAAARRRLANQRAWRRSPRGRLEALAAEVQAVSGRTLRAGRDLAGYRAAAAIPEFSEAAQRLTRLAAAARRALRDLEASEGRPE